MNINSQLKDKIQELYDNTPENIHGVALGKKQKNGQDTGKTSIVFYVDKKIPKDQIPEGETIPSTIMVDGSVVETDVQEAARLKMATCYAAGDPNITRLQARQSGEIFLDPMRGGQEIIQFPTNWVSNGTGWTVKLGTLGFFCVDDIDGKIIGMTNAHVAIKDYRFCSERDADGYNAHDATIWNVDPDLGPVPQGALSSNGPSFLEWVGIRVKRYSGSSSVKTNYVDAAVMMMNPSFLDANSYKIWGPIGVDPFSSPLPFATTAEIDALLSTNPRLFSTGRTSGPKGFTDSSSCRLRVKAIGLAANVDGDTYGDLIQYHYEDNSPDPILAGDSGSALIALIGATYKIVGLAFAGDTNGVTGSSTFGVACRIDRVADEMKIRAWDGTLNTSLSDRLGEMLIQSNDPRAGQTSFVHTDGYRYWQMGFKA